MISPQRISFINGVLDSHFKNSRNNETGRFDPLELPNGYKVSIQGSKFAYSSPRIDCPTLAAYEEVEIAVFGSKGEWCGNFPAKYNFESGSCPVAGYMSIADVYELVQLVAQREKEGELKYGELPQVQSRAGVVAV